MRVLRVIVLVLGMLGLLPAAADVLYWQLTQDAASESFMYAFAQVTGQSQDAAHGDVYMRLYAVEPGSAGGEITRIDYNMFGAVKPDGDLPSGVGMAEIPRSDLALYYVELGLIDENGTVVPYFATQNGMSYSQLVDIGAVMTSQTGVYDRPWNPSAGVWTPVTAVPEPTSGLLVVIGFAILSLRRRRGHE